MAAQWEDSDKPKNSAVWEQAEPQINKPLQTIRKGLQGMTLGLSDEIGSRVAAQVATNQPPFTIPPVEGVPVPEGAFTQPPGDEEAVYSEMMQGYRDQEQEFEKRHPKTAMAAEIAGALTTGGIGAAKTAGLTGIKRVGALAGEGLLYGGISGAGKAEPGERLEEAFSQGMVGMGLSLAIPFAGSLVGKTVNKLIRKQPLNKADRSILKAIQADEQTPAEIRELLKKWPDATITDVGGKNMVSLVREARAVPGEAGNLAENFFMDRMKGEYTRLLSAFKKGLGKSGEFFKTKKALADSRKEIAGPLYREAYDTPIVLTPGLKSMLKRPAIKSALRIAKVKSKNEGVTLPKDSIDVRTLDYAKRALDDKIGTLKRAGKRDDARILTQLKNQMLDEVDAQAPKFKQARSIWSSAAELDDALEDGAKFLRGDSDMIAQDIAKLSDGQKEFFRLGAMRGIKSFISKTRDANSVAAKFQNPAMRERLEAIFPDKKAFNEIVDFIEKESRFGVIRNDVLRGSQTYEKFLANQAQEGFADAAIDLAQGRGAGLIRAMGGAAAKKIAAPNPGVAADIVRRSTVDGLADNLQYLQKLQKGGAQVHPKYRQLLDAMALGGSTLPVNQ